MGARNCWIAVLGVRWQGLARIFGSLSFLQRISFHEQYVEQQRGCTGFQDGCLQEWAQATLGDGAARRQCCDLTFLAARRGTVPGGTGQTRGLEQVPVVPCGGFSCAIKGHLRDVQYIQATKDACAALLGNGLVVTWGMPGCSGCGDMGQCSLWR